MFAEKIMNIEHRTSNNECWMGKDKETDLWPSKKPARIIKKPELLIDILAEPEELIKILVTSIKTVEKKQK